mmetsp:Transcript_80780/g.215607  ORF Transcript_80780/g.215607 Transcript_80780/m.215607 type:complete len:519 (+) Transcript_80780:17-1573(+)
MGPSGVRSFPELTHACKATYAGSLQHRYGLSQSATSLPKLGRPQSGGLSVSEVKDLYAPLETPGHTHPARTAARYLDQAAKSYSQVVLPPNTKLRHQADEMLVTVCVQRLDICSVIFQRRPREAVKEASKVVGDVERVLPAKLEEAPREFLELAARACWYLAACRVGDSTAVGKVLHIAQRYLTPLDPEIRRLVFPPLPEPPESDDEASSDEGSSSSVAAPEAPPAPKAAARPPKKASLLELMQQPRPAHAKSEKGPSGRPVKAKTSRRRRGKKNVGTAKENPFTENSGEHDAQKVWYRKMLLNDSFVTSKCKEMKLQRTLNGLHWSTMPADRQYENATTYSDYAQKLRKKLELKIHYNELKNKVTTQDKTVIQHGLMRLEQDREDDVHRDPLLGIVAPDPDKAQGDIVEVLRLSKAQHRGVASTLAKMRQLKQNASLAIDHRQEAVEPRKRPTISGTPARQAAQAKKETTAFMEAKRLQRTLKGSLDSLTKAHKSLDLSKDPNIDEAVAMASMFRKK